MEIKRRRAKGINIGNICIGGDNPIAIQSMVKTRTADIDKTVREIKKLEELGCELVRLAIKDNQDVRAIKKIKEAVHIPLVADIHFHWRLAIGAIDNGADKIRLNPGNLRNENELREIISALKSAKVPLRIGVNSGSLRGLDSQNLDMATRLVNASLDYIRKIEKLKFYKIVVSLKGSTVLDTLEAYRKMSRSCDYPFHLGVTATGLSLSGAIKSSIVIGALLLEGIGDTIRVSLTDKSQEEVKIAKIILEALGLRYFGPEIISCPTCGRCEVDLVKIVKDLQNKLDSRSFSPASLPIKLAVMGCVVNGPGEASQADIGVAFGKKEGLLFKNGEALRKISSSGCVDALLELCALLKGR